MEEIKFIKSMETLNIKDGDILVVRIDQKLRADLHHALRDYCKQNLPDKMKDTKVFILEPGTDLGVVRKDAA